MTRPPAHLTPAYTPQETPMTTPLPTDALPDAWLNAVHQDRRPDREAVFNAWLTRESAHPNPEGLPIPEAREVRRYYPSGNPDRAAAFDAWYNRDVTPTTTAPPRTHRIKVTDTMLLAALRDGTTPVSDHIRPASRPGPTSRHRRPPAPGREILDCIAPTTR